MLINELSKQTGVSIHTIRYYENLGLIQGTTDDKVKTNNYKNYDERAAERLEIIVEAKQVGFSLAEIRQLLANWYESETPQEDQLELFHKKIAEINLKIDQLKQVKKRLEKVVQELENGECES